MSITASTTAILASGPWNDGPWHDGPPAFWPIFPILWLLVVAGIITAVIVLARRARQVWPGRVGEAKLAERYAAGEIDAEEFRTRREVLRERPQKQ